jgi:hypothetical protein
MKTIKNTFIFLIAFVSCGDFQDSSKLQKVTYQRKFLGLSTPFQQELTIRKELEGFLVHMKKTCFSGEQFLLKSRQETILEALIEWDRSLKKEINQLKDQQFRHLKTKNILESGNMPLNLVPYAFGKEINLNVNFAAFSYRKKLIEQNKNLKLRKEKFKNDLNKGKNEIKSLQEDCRSIDKAIKGLRQSEKSLSKKDSLKINKVRNQIAKKQKILKKQKSKITKIEQNLQKKRQDHNLEIRQFKKEKQRLEAQQKTWTQDFAEWISKQKIQNAPIQDVSQLSLLGPYTEQEIKAVLEASREALTTYFSKKCTELKHTIAEIEEIEKNPEIKTIIVVAYEQKTSPSLQTEFDHALKYLKTIHRIQTHIIDNSAVFPNLDSYHHMSVSKISF